MPSIRSEDLTPFGRIALKLDSELGELARAGEQMEKVNIESDNGLDEGIKILNRVASYGQSVAETMQQFAVALQEARDKAETATNFVAERAQAIKARRQREDQLHERLDKVQEDVKATGASLAAFGKPAKGELTDDERKAIAAELAKLAAPMDGFIAAAQTIKDEAGAANFKRLERQAEAMIDALKASRRKIEQAVAPK